MSYQHYLKHNDIITSNKLKGQNLRTVVPHPDTRSHNTVFKKNSKLSSVHKTGFNTQYLNLFPRALSSFSPIAPVPHSPSQSFFPNFP